MNLPIGDRAELLKIMVQLKNERKAVEVKPGKWMEGKGADPKIRLIKFDCREVVRVTIGEDGGSASRAHLISELFHFIIESEPEFRNELGVSWSSQESRQKAEEFIDEMIAEGYILRKGTNCTLASTHST